MEYKKDREVNQLQNRCHQYRNCSSRHSCKLLTLDGPLSDRYCTTAELQRITQQKVSARKEPAVVTHITKYGFWKKDFYKTKTLHLRIVHINSILKFKGILWTGDYSTASSLTRFPGYFPQEILTCRFSFNNQIFHLILHMPSEMFPF